MDFSELEQPMQGFTWSLISFGKNPQTSQGADPDVPCEESIPHFPRKRSPTPPWGKRIQTMPPMLQTGPIPILSNPYGAKWMENLKWPHLYLWLGWWQRDRGCTAQVITLLILSHCLSLQLILKMGTFQAASNPKSRYQVSSWELRRICSMPLS